MTPSDTIAWLLKVYHTLPPGCMLWRLGDYLRWIGSGGCIIRDVHGILIAMRLNVVQQTIIAAMIEQAMAGQPIRIVILKARKTGVSTLVETLAVRLCQRNREQVARVIAHKAEATHEIFEIAKRAAVSGRLGGNVKAASIEFGASNYACYTAGGAGVGAGGTPSMLHLSEVGLWPMVLTPEKAEEAEYTSIESVPLVAETIIVYESTSRGRNLMWRRFADARDGKTRYRAIFVPWFADPSKTVLVDHLDRTDEERQLVRRAHNQGIEITDGMLAWRREGIAELGEHLFKQEHPATPEESVESARGLVVPGLRECIVKELPFVYVNIPDHDRVGGWDYGYNDPSALVTGVVWDNVLWVVDVSRGAGLRADEMATYFTIWPRHTYYCDPSALGPRHELQKACRDRDIVAQFVQAPAGRGDATLAREEDAWGTVRQFIADGRVRVHVECAEQLLAESEAFVYNATTGKPEKNRDEIHGHFDTLDALRYMLGGVTRIARTVIPTKRSVTRREQLRA